MKIKAGQRILIVLLSVILIGVVTVLMLCCWGVISAKDILAAISYLSDNILANIAVTLLGVLIVIYAFCMMFVASKPPTPSEAVIKVTDNGSVRITLQTLTALTVKYCRSVAGVRDVRVSTGVGLEGVTVKIRAALSTDSVIPDVTAAVQQTVKANIESMTGLHVQGVTVVVDNSIVANM